MKFEVLENLIPSTKTVLRSNFDSKLDKSVTEESSKSLKSVLVIL